MFVVTDLYTGAPTYCRIQLSMHHFSGRCLCTTSQVDVCAPLLRSMYVHRVAEALQYYVEFCTDTLSSRDVFMTNQSIMSKNTINMVLMDLSCRAFFGRGGVCYWDHICFVSGSYPYIQRSSPVIICDLKFATFFFVANSQRSVQMDIHAFSGGA
ncbi:hypothetical protein BsWGS_16781 [Bradybaena similaris]